MARPTLPKGYLGAQTKFAEFGMSTVSHNSPEITTDSSPLNVKLKTSKSLKLTANLVICSTEDEHKEYIFIQTEEQGKQFTLVVNLPSHGFFKLQIFALPTDDDSKSLPNVFNYIIHNTVSPPGPVPPFPRQFATWKDGCYLFKPYHLSQVDCSPFEVVIPGASAVAVTVEKEWFHLEKGSDGVWRGEAKGLGRFRGKGAKAVLNASLGAEKNKYTSLLEYAL